MKLDPEILLKRNFEQTAGNKFSPVIHILEIVILFSYWFFNRYLLVTPIEIEKKDEGMHWSFIHRYISYLMFPVKMIHRGVKWSDLLKK